MDLARIRSNITSVPVAPILAAGLAVSIMSIMSTTAGATPPSSELNGVAKIAPPADVDVDVAAAVEPVAEVVPTPSALIIDASNRSVEAGGVADSQTASEVVRTIPEPVDGVVVESGPLDLEDGVGVGPGDDPDEASRTAAAAVLSTAGEIASFDRTPIFGRPGETPGPAAAGTPAITTTPAGNGGSWWNAPELRVFGLLAVLVFAAVFMKRHGGRSIGLAGGPRPSGVVSVLGRFPFGRSASLVLLECGPKVLLLHQHAGKGGDVTTLAEFSDLDEVADLRGRLSATERDAKGGFGRELEQTLGLYDRRGRPRGFGGEDGLPVQGPIETVDLTRRRPRRGVRGN
jgi:flagellar biogenesis protein FliO